MKQISKTISLKSDLWDKLEEISKETDISRSSLIHIALFNFFEIKQGRKGLIHNSNFLKKVTQ